ncbi:MAG TPA: efflux RND transporter permease subunit, partial [Gemmatimonadaceae bacterium]|nr:efflux RND transporter permease subunit [Gemmatimonadaceae bacterium]
DAVANQNVNLPTGVLWGKNRAFTVQANGQLSDAAGFRRMTVAYRNGAPVHLGDLGDVFDDVQNNKIASWYEGVGTGLEHSVILAIQRQPGSNTVAVADGVKTLVDKLRTQIPPSVEIHTLFDRTIGIQDSVDDVKGTLLLTLVLVVVVIFLFLRNASATVIPSLALPISVIGTFAVMYTLDYSLDNLSLMALTLAVGFVVDDAIVMLENIVRHMEMGKPAMRAAFDGAREVGFTILSMTLSLTAVFIPILFLGGIIGRLFHEFAVTIAVSILVSGFVSLTLTPMLSSRFLSPDHGEEHGWLFNVTERGWESVSGLYARTLGWAVRHRRIMLAFSLVILVATGFLFHLVPKGFMPSEDTGRLNATVEMAQGTSYDDMVAHQQEVNAVIAKDTQDVAGFMSSIGTLGGGTVSFNQGRLFMGLAPRKQRKSADQIIQTLRAKVAHIPGVSVFFQNPPLVQIGARASKGLYQYQMQSADITALYAGANKLTDALKTSPLLQDVTTDLQLGNPQATIVVDRERASSLGVAAADVEQTLYDAYGSRQVSTIYTPNNEYWVVMELLPQYQRDLSALSLLYVASNTGALVPLSAVSTVSQTAGPLTVNHAGQLPAVTLSFNLPPGVALGQAVAEIQNVAADVLPSSVTGSVAGAAQAFQDAQSGLLALLGIAIFVIYVVLGILYESFIHPLTILSGLPFAAFGALLTLYVFHIDLSVYAFVGIILLVGLVKKNAIMMIDFALETERNEGLAPADAILRACHIRFRPIMMTTMCALMGTLPIALSTGAGAESRRPLGIAVVGGLAFSQLITLYITPVVYVYMHRLSEWIDARVSRTRRANAAAPGHGHGAAVAAGHSAIDGGVPASAAGDD